jgi:hypothetical protein
MTSEIAAPAFGTADGGHDLLPDGAEVVGAVPDAWVVVGVCPEWLFPPSKPPCEHPPTNPTARKGTATSAAIRIPPG